MPSLKELSRQPEIVTGGHRLCAGCGAPIVVRQALKALKHPVVVANATGCLEVATAIYPYTAWRCSWIHSAFENAAATMSGVEAAYRSLKRQGKIKDEIRFIAFGGDGGTFDIGFQSLSGAMERGHRMVYLCYDNEAYMNTGIQRSSATPMGAETTTTPAGQVIPGKVQHRKDLTAIMAAHDIPYVAQVSPSHWNDLVTKLEKAFEADGPAFINAIAPCPRGWRHDGSLTKQEAGGGVAENAGAFPSSLPAGEPPHRRRRSGLCGPEMGGATEEGGVLDTVSQEAMGLVRVRFAPSPTGELHIGGARTALFNWLFARHHGGRFVLRMEDTDLKRSREELVTPMLEAFRWLGIDWDEGPEVDGPYGPYFQSQRLELYQTHAQKLLEAGQAYRCYCTPDELAARREEAIGQGRPPRYDRRCRGLTRAEEERLAGEGRRPVLRLKMPLEGSTVVSDLIRGDVTFEHAVLDDWVLVKSDGMPTYNFACVVDDATMRITHVIRGEEHLSNTPKQVLLYQALGYPLPAFAHLPMILAPDRSKLSKRHGATAVHEYRERGYLPGAVVNYLATLGWSPEGEVEILPREDMVARFDLGRVSKSAAIYDNEKLTWMNGQYLRMASPRELAEWALPFWQVAGLVPARVDERMRSYLESVMEAMRERVRTLAEVPEATRYFFRDDFSYDEKGVRKHFARPGVADMLEQAAQRLEGLEAWEAGVLEDCYRTLAGEKGIGAGELIHPTRLALTGRTVGPGLFELMAILGRQASLARLRRAVAWIRGR